jgi:hypothetical protein
MATIEAMAIAVVAKITKTRCWLFISNKKRYSLIAKTSTHRRKMMVYFVFINIGVLNLTTQIANNSNLKGWQDTKG